MRFGIAAMYQDPLDQVRFAAAVEECGYDLVGYGDTQSLLPDAFVGLSAMACATERVLLCTTVGNPVTRHPAVVASACSALQRLSGGRMRYGIGTGDSAVRLIGRRPATVAEMEEFCVAFRALVRGDAAEWRGDELRLEFPPEPVPLWMAAEGPRMLHLAGRVADGVIMGNGISEAVVRDNIERIAAGARSAGREPGDLELWFMAKPYLAPTEEQAVRETAFSLAASANHAFRATMDAKHLPDELRPGMQRLLAGYRSTEHNLPDKGAHNASLVLDSGLGEHLGRRFLLGGPPERIGQRLRELAGWGATNLMFAGVFGDPIDYARTIATEVLAPLRAEG